LQVGQVSPARALVKRIGWPSICGIDADLAVSAKDDSAMRGSLKLMVWLPVASPTMPESRAGKTALMACTFGSRAWKLDEMHLFQIRSW
jgi:hypothetical protein